MKSNKNKGNCIKYYPKETEYCSNCKNLTGELVSINEKTYNNYKNHADNFITNKTCKAYPNGIPVFTFEVSCINPKPSNYEITFIRNYPTRSLNKQWEIYYEREKEKETRGGYTFEPTEEFKTKLEKYKLNWEKENRIFLKYFTPEKMANYLFSFFIISVILSILWSIVG